MPGPKVDMFMPLWIGDYMADTPHLGAEEHGAYLLLLMAAWRFGGRLPIDQEQLRLIAKVRERRWPQVWGMIARFFQARDGHLVQERLVRELDLARKNRDAFSAAGRASVAARRARTGTAQPARKNVSARGGSTGGVSEHETEQQKQLNYAKPHEQPRTTFAPRSSIKPRTAVEPSPSPSQEEKQSQPSPIGSNLEWKPPSLPPGAWGPYEWLVEFKKAWCKAKGEVAYDRGAADVDAMRKLGPKLSAVPQNDLLAAQARAGLMFERFFGERGNSADKAHPFSYFVHAFTDHRVATKGAMSPAVEQEDTLVLGPPARRFE